MIDEQPTTEDQLRRISQSDELESVNKSRSARVATYGEEQIGVCIFLTASELRELGVKLSESETEVVEYAIDKQTRTLMIWSRNR